MKRELLLWIGLWALACTPRLEEPPTVELTAVSNVAPLSAYAVCSSSDECGSLSCVSLLGQKVCATIGCATEPALCSAAEQCVVSPMAADGAGVCAHTGASDFCGRNCRDRLVCGLDAECVQAGCCGTSEMNGCPSVCGMMGRIECEVDPRCEATCCSQ